MTVLGIIAEYNPFHSGHAYQIEALKKKINADHVVIVMSGNFVQRGAPALTDKYTRARMALSGGADLVLELPVRNATASAEYFAKGGIQLLNRTGVVTHLGFGTETANFSLLQDISTILLDNPPAFQEKLREELKKGLSFPAARANALASVFATSDRELSQVQTVLSSPNNILAVEYLKALYSISSPILPVPLLRKGQDYHNTDITDGFWSASAIRNQLQNNADSLSDILCEDSIMPVTSRRILSTYPHPFLFEDDFSQLVHYKLLTETPEQLKTYADSSAELINRIYRTRSSFTSWSDFCRLLKTKNITYTRISRLLLHMILNITSEDYTPPALTASSSYLRVLGFRKSAAALLRCISRQGDAPLLTRTADGDCLLSPEALSCLHTDIRASDIYNLILTSKGSRQICDDYRHPIVTI